MPITRDDELKTAFASPVLDGPGFAASGNLPRVRSIEEAEVVIQSLYARQAIVEDLARDHAERFDTLQTPLWKRIWFAIDGWPWYDLNGAQKRRPWHRRAR